MNFTNVEQVGRPRFKAIMFFLVGTGALLTLLPLLNLGSWIMHIIIMVMFYAMLSSAWNLLGGYTGQFSVGHAAYVGLTGYIMGILLARGIAGPLTGAVLGVAAAVLLAFLVGACTMRLRGIFFALTTLALTEILRKLALFHDKITGGPLGLSLVIHGPDKVHYYYIMLAMLMLALFVSLRFEYSRFGMFCVAIRENEEAAASTGINTNRYKILAAMLSAFFTGMGGAFYAAYIGIIEPDVVFSFNLSIKLIILTIIGGTGTVLGPLLGAVIVVIPDELIRGYIGGSYAGFSGMIYGVILILIILFKPAGLGDILRFILPAKRD